MKKLFIRALQGILASLVVGRILLSYWPVVVVLVLLTFMYHVLTFKRKRTCISYDD